tara:strand:- start:1162 stop:2022 length:861 start_codon:yes stop_codon:yes gene_type:complete
MWQGIATFFEQLAHAIAYLAWAELATTVFVTFLTAAAGAGAGALIAQRVIERGKSKGDLITEIRNTNAAVSISHDILNVFLGLKRQHIIKLKSDFEASRNALDDFHAARNAGDTTEVFEFQMDLQSIPDIIVPDERLQNIAFEQLSIVGKPINFTSVLVRSIHSLKKSIEKRNQLIEEFRGIAPNDNTRKVHLYFGLPDEHGHTDENYPNTIQAISQYTDDCIWFSKSLIAELSKHGEGLKAKFKKDYRDTPPKVASIDMTNVEEGLIPSDEDFADWTAGFIEREP